MKDQWWNDPRYVGFAVISKHCEVCGKKQNHLLIHDSQECRDYAVCFECEEDTLHECKEDDNVIYGGN